MENVLRITYTWMTGFQKITQRTIVELESEEEPQVIKSLIRQNAPGCYGIDAEMLQALVEEAVKVLYKIFGIAESGIVHDAHNTSSVKFYTTDTDKKKEDEIEKLR